MNEKSVTFQKLPTSWNSTPPTKHAKMEEDKGTMRANWDMVSSQILILKVLRSQNIAVL